MNRLVLLAAMLVCAFVSPSFAQPVETKTAWVNLVNQAYGYMAVQNATFDYIIKTYPQLAREAQLVKSEFDSSALGEGAKGIEQLCMQMYGKDFPKVQKLILEHASKIAPQHAETREMAARSLAGIRLSVKGEMHEPTRATLLAANPRYMKSPVLELTAGWKKSYRTKGHPKAKGIDLTISYPYSWYKREGNRPNVIQVFESQFGHGGVMFTIMVKDMPEKLSMNDLKELFSPAELKHMVPPGGKFINAQSLVIESLPAGMLVCDVSQQRMEHTVNARTTQFILLYEQHMIFLQFIAAPLPNTGLSIDELHTKYLPLYKAIANTLVLNDKYK